jgi:hypothetical protein
MKKVKLFCFIIFSICCLSKGFGMEPSGPVYNVDNSGTCCFLNAPLQCLRYIPLFREILKHQDNELAGLLTSLFAQMDLCPKTQMQEFRETFCDLYCEYIRHKPKRARVFDSDQDAFSWKEGYRDAMDNFLIPLLEMFNVGINEPVIAPLRFVYIFTNRFKDRIYSLQEMVVACQREEAAKKILKTFFRDEINETSSWARVLVIVPKLDNRYGLKETGGKVVSSGCGVRYDENIDLTPYLESVGLSVGVGCAVTYDLVGAVCHVQDFGGHYIAYVKANDKWYMCDSLGGPDAQEQLENIEEVLKQRECVMLFYRLNHDSPIHPETLFTWEHGEQHKQLEQQLAVRDFFWGVWEGTKRGLSRLIWR